MLIKKPTDIPSSEITTEYLYRNRRQFFKAAAATIGAVAFLPTSAFAAGSKYDTDEKQTPMSDVTSYNNYYEFGTGKDEPSVNARSFKTKPWTVAVTGM